MKISDKALKKAIKPAQRLVIQFLPLLVALLFVVGEIRRVANQVAVRYPDFFGWAERAASLNFRDFTDPNWVHGLYPLGYPVLLRLGVELGANVLDTAFALSIFGGFLGLVGTFWLVKRMTDSWGLAILSEISLACMSFYLFYANLDATDMLAAGLQICSLALLMGKRIKYWEAGLAGLLVGWSYLIRYTASMTVLPCALFLFILLLRQRDREHFIILGLYLFAAFLGGAPQFLTSTLIKGNPLYNEQAHNLWFHLQNSADYIFKWHEVPMDISLVEVIGANPRAFFEHWWTVFKSYWLTGDGYAVDGILGLFIHAGFWFTLLASRPPQGETQAPVETQDLASLQSSRHWLRPTARLFMALYIVGFVAVLSLTRLDRRFMITLMPFQVLGSLYFVWHLLPAHLKELSVKGRHVIIPVRIPLLLLLVVSYLSTPLGFIKANPFDEEIVNVSNTLHAAGMQSADEVFSTHVDYHDVASRWKWRFDMAFPLPDLDTYSALRGHLLEHGYRYFIFDQGTGLFLYPDLEFLLHPDNRPEGLTPIYVPDKREAIIYRVERPELQPKPEPVSAEFEIDSASDLGVILTGYTLHLSDDIPAGSGKRLGLYLHWQTEVPLDKWYKVFVHLIDDQGQLVAQHDGLPALWTYPTDRWMPGEEVIDFHQLGFAPETANGPFSLRVGLYDPANGQRLTISRIADPPYQAEPDGPIKDYVTLKVLEIQATSTHSDF